MGQNHRLLVVDDDSLWLEQVPMILEETCQVDAYSTLDQAFEAIQSQPYDVLLLDLNFEGDSRTGLDIVRKVHSYDRDMERMSEISVGFKEGQTLFKLPSVGFAS